MVMKVFIDVNESEDFTLEQEKNAKALERIKIWTKKLFFMEKKITKYRKIFNILLNFYKKLLTFHINYRKFTFVSLY